MLRYFLRLGALGFGGPIALAGYMQRDLVERRRWFSKEEYVEGLALAQLAPGPLAAQLAIYLGWARGGFVGATLVAIAFILPSFLMVMVIAALYLEQGGLPWMQGLFYGVGAAVIAIIARSAHKLTRLTIGRDLLLWFIFLTTGAITVILETEVIWAFLASGLLVMIVRGWSSPSLPARSIPLLSWPPMLLTGLSGVAETATLWRVALYFAEAGAFVFGSGLAIVPFLHQGVVQEYHWLSDRQFLDAVAVAMITPGPVVITVAFIGYLAAGPIGGLVAAIGVFLPCYLFVVLPAPYYRRFANNRTLKSFIDGVTAAATGAIAGAVIVLGRRAITDVATVAISILTLMILLRFKKVPEPVIVAAAGVAGVLLAAL
jgi:chromate transporter